MYGQPNQDLGSKVEAIIPEPALLDSVDGTVRVADNLTPAAVRQGEGMSGAPQGVNHSSSAPRDNPNLVDVSTEPRAVPGKDAKPVMLDPAGLPIIEVDKLATDNLAPL